MQIIVYHKDQDGAMSAAVITEFLKRMSIQNEIVYIPAQYNEISQSDILSKYSVDEIDNLWIVDFSFPGPEMQNLKSLLGLRLFWFDHHDTAIKMSEEFDLSYICGKRESKDMTGVKRAACELIYRETIIRQFGKIEIPKAVSLIGSWDTFRWKQEKNQKAYALKLWTDKHADPTKIENIQTYINMLSLENESKIDEGLNMISDIEAADKMLMDAQCIEVEIDGFHGLAVNKVVNSLAFDSVVDHDKHDFIMSFAYVKSGQWRFSIFNESENGLHCGELCKKIGGGGGHAGAGGFMLKNKEFFEFFSKITQK